MGLLEQYGSGEILLIAPDLLLAEFASLVSKRTRRRQISNVQALHAFHLIEQFALRLFDTRPLLEVALPLALSHHLSLWDCVYLALAIEHSCPFITADRRLFKSSVSRHPAMRLLS